MDSRTGGGAAGAIFLSILFGKIDSNLVKIGFLWKYKVGDSVVNIDNNVNAAAEWKCTFLNYIE